MIQVKKIVIGVCCFFAFACHHDSTSHEGVTEEVAVPVTVTTANQEVLAEYIELNATSAYLQKSFIKASANGYIRSATVKLGDVVAAGNKMFTLETKEANSIGNAINSLDSSFRFSGVITIRSSAAGIVAELNHQPGDYVQDGEQLAVINNKNSFGFQMSVPYELRPYITANKTFQLTLPDGKKMQGTITSILPVVDSASQTLPVMINVPDANIPINLIAKVSVQKTVKSNALSLPRPAVLADETQTHYWVMKVIDSNTAVRIDIVKGVETTDRIEIVSPSFSLNDRFLLTGNYGLGDTAKIKIVPQIKH